MESEPRKATLLTHTYYNNRKWNVESKRFTVFEKLNISFFFTSNACMGAVALPRRLANKVVDVSYPVSMRNHILNQLELSILDYKMYKFQNNSQLSCCDKTFLHPDQPHIYQFDRNPRSFDHTSFLINVTLFIPPDIQYILKCMKRLRDL